MYFTGHKRCGCSTTCAGSTSIMARLRLWRYMPTLWMLCFQCDRATAGALHVQQELFCLVGVSGQESWRLRWPSCAALLLALQCFGLLLGVLSLAYTLGLLPVGIGCSCLCVPAASRVLLFAPSAIPASPWQQSVSLPGILAVVGPCMV